MIGPRGAENRAPAEQAGWTDADGPPRRAGQALAVLLLAGLLTVGGVAVLGAVGDASSRQDPVTTTTDLAGSGDGTVPTAGPAPTISAPWPSATDSSSTSPATEAGTAVAVRPGVAGPDVHTVATLLDAHFGAINDKDFDTWRGTVTDSRARDQSESAWREGYRSTRLSDVVLESLRVTGTDSAVAEVSFVSTQSIADAPADLPVGRICWIQRLPIGGLGSDPLIGLPRKGSASMREC